MESNSMNDQSSDEFRVSIFRVPQSLCKGNEAAYLPEMVRLGIFSRCASSPNVQDDPLQEMETEKKRILQEGWDLENPEEFRKMAANSIDCYKPQLKKKDDPKIPQEMLEDAAYILEYLRSLSNKPGDSPKPDVIIVTEIMKDMLKLQNQIPLRLLKEVYNRKFPDHFDKFLKQSLSKISPFHSFGNVESLASVKFGNSQHLLQCCHKMVLGSDQGNETLSNGFTKFLHCCHKKVVGSKCLADDTSSNGGTSGSDEIYLGNAMKLRRAGIRFKPLPNDLNGIQHIKFEEEDCTLHLPRMSMGLVYSEVIWKNLIAFELCSPDIRDKGVVSFVHFMDDLINVEDDIQLFIRSKIFRHVRCDQKVTQFWNTLSHSTRRPPFKPIDDAKEKMNEVYKRRRMRKVWNRLVESYRPRPWTFISAIATAFIVLLTVVQVTCAFYSCNTIFVEETTPSP